MKSSSDSRHFLYDGRVNIHYSPTTLRLVLARGAQRLAGGRRTSVKSEICGFGHALSRASLFSWDRPDMATDIIAEALTTRCALG